MKEYYDEAILKKWEEAKKAKYNSVEEGYYINGKTIYFKKETIMNFFTIYIPEIMGVMPAEIAKIKYPSEFRPPMILTTLNLSVNMGFNIFYKTIMVDELEGITEKMVASIKRDHPNYKFSFIKKMKGIAGFWFDFRSHAMDSDLYNMMLLALIDKKAVMVNFNCSYMDREKWRECVIMMWETICPKNNEE